MKRAEFVTAVLGSRPVAAAFRSALRGRLRVLAYHDVRDQRTFERHVAHLLEHYAPVDAEAVRAAQRGGRLPPRAVWLTFDDGYPDVVELAMPVLDDIGIRACLFVCPGVVDTDVPYWWQVVDASVDRGLHDRVAPGRPAAGLRAALKRVPDEQRRATVAELGRALEAEAPEDAFRRQITSEQLAAWVGSGHDLGNHSWDHPLLDRCAPDEQVRQIAEADEWLAGLGLGPVDFFAYPNGNVAPAAEAELRARRYQAPLLFDHATARVPRPRISRLRLDAFASEARMRAVTSGAHPFAFAAARAARGG